MTKSAAGEPAEASTAGPDRYRSLFESSQDPILIIEDDRFVDCNQAAVEMLGHDGKATVLQTHPSEISPEYQPDGQRSFDKANEILGDIRVRSSRYFEWMHVRADGSPLPVEVSMTALPTTDGHQLHIVWRDLRKRRRLERELQHAQKMEALGNLAAGIAHDFNNTLVPIVTYSSLLEESLSDQPQLQKWAHEVSRAGMLAGSLVRKLLAVSGKEGQGLMPVTVDLGEAVEASIRMLRKLVGERITLRFGRPTERLPVRTEPGDIELILLNLASNARDAMPSGGAVDVSLAAVEQSGRPLARLRFADDGVGMDPETVEQVFEPFFTTKEIGSGTGLGLSSVHELVTRAKGSVEVTSSVGGGTTIDILVPLVADASEPRVSDSPAPVIDPDSIDRPRVMIVEDDEQILRLVADLLDREGYRVHVASNAVRALETLETLEPDLLLSDVIMPSMSGPEMVQELRRRGCEVPVLFVTGYDDHRLEAHGFDPADVAILHKPFTAEQLMDSVRRALVGTATDES